MKKNILITGGAGFIGSNFILHILKKYPRYKIVNLDCLTYAGNLENVKEAEKNENYCFIEGNICDKALVQKIFQEKNITDVIHFAAESHVDNSISGPGIFVQTNIEGTFILLEVAKKNWGESCSNRFHHISTDEVYGTLGKTGLFTEKTPYAPNSPYSASKASSDMLVRSFHHTYGMNTIITNCSNNYGPRQHDEKLIPTIIRSALSGKKIPIYGSGENVRDWLFVEDHCEGIDAAFHSGKSGETYNIGGNNEWNNLAIAKKICKILDKKVPQKNGKPYTQLISFVPDRLGHDFRYAIDSTKIQTELGWKSEKNFSTRIEETINWYIEKYTN